TQGQPTNVQTRFALPGGYFEEAAEEAVSRARYTPATLNGEAIEHPGLVVQFNFELVDRDEDTD
ncbi:MAG: energy transducer TonB, partial [Pseudomonadota bacterium]|nr:energy transducer TonB [Pseudomonadota bacterium]